MSKEQLSFVKSIKNKKRLVIFLQLLICIGFLISWELLSKYDIINPFIFSSPSACIRTLKDLWISGDLFTHIFTTLNELFISFALGIGLGMMLAISLYSFPLLNRVLEPFLTMLNSLPKVALGPILIIWFGANTKTIVVMSLLINLIVSTITILNGFNNTDYIKFKLLKTFGANKLQTLRYLVIPGSLPTIISAIKLNVSMSLIGVIMGEFLVSRKGIGYLIIYGTQVFNLDLVFAGVFILIIISFVLYKIILVIENIVLKKQ